MYQHTQSGIGVWIVTGLAFLLIVTALAISLHQLHRTGAVYPSDQDILLRLLGLAFILGMVLLLFYRLTVSVDENYVRAIFGIGIVCKRIPLSDITEARPVTNSWWYGWGIRLIPGGWMWNIGGQKAVELTLKNGRKFRLGTDEPEALEAAIRARISV